MLLAVSIPLLTNATVTIQPSPLVQRVFDLVEELPSGSRVILSFDYDPASEAELSPMATAFLRHCALKRHRMILMTLWPTGSLLVERNVTKILQGEFQAAELKLGVDYVNLGFRPGNEVAIKTVATDLKGLFTTDAEGNSTATLPILTDLAGAKDADLILNVSAGFPGGREWIQYATTTHRIPIVVGCTGVQAPQLYPYLPDQLRGILAAIKGAAEYESALGAKYPQYAPASQNAGIRRMGPQLYAHRLMIALIVLGNLGLLFSKRSRRS